MNSIYERFKERGKRWRTRQILIAQHLKVTSPKKLSKLSKTKEELKEREKCLKRLRQRKKELEKEYLEKEKEVLEDEKEDTENKNLVSLKGTQHTTPQNDYCQHYIDTGDRPQNFIRDVGLKNRFEEYPKLRELIIKKDQLIQQTNTAPMYLKCDLETFKLADLKCKFDVILLEPPLEEYQGVHDKNYKHWSWKQIENLAIEQIASSRSFLWMWCGSSSGLDAGRSCLKKWGFRRCEDICWIKTNAQRTGPDKNYGLKSIFQRSKEHCLMGIKGTVRRSTDGEFIHANVDIDLIIEEEPSNNSDDKPQEIFHIIEHFCLGRRRLHLFGKDASVRAGWLTVGPHLTSSNFDSERYNNFFTDAEGGLLSGCTEDIERLRPKSPPPKSSGQGRNMHKQPVSSVMAPSSLMMMAPPAHIMPPNPASVMMGMPANVAWNVQR